MIISGFSHLIWLILLAIIIVDPELTEVIKYLPEINSGGAALLLTSTIGFSFFLGKTC